MRYKFIRCCIPVKFQVEMVVLKVLREFAGGTSIHGFTSLVNPKLSSRTKIIWAIAIVVALSYASWEMKNSVIGKYHYILEPWNRNQCLLSNIYVQISLLKVESPFLVVCSIYNPIITICWLWNLLQSQRHLSFGLLFLFHGSIKQPCND